LKLIVYALGLGLFTLSGGFMLVLGQAIGGGGDASSFVGALVAVGFFWLFIYLFFVISAMAVSDAGLLEAIRRSVILLRENFWSALALVVLVVFLDQGLARMVWSGLMVGPLAPLAIAANAYVSTSLLAASMVYYQDRTIWMEKIRARPRPVRR
jgi:hypothetical protein